MTSSINGKVALVTGASSGIGEAISITLAKDGAKVALMARRIEKLEEIKKKISDNGGTAIAVQADVTVRQQVVDGVKKIESELGTVDILINNAGIANCSPITKVKLDEWLEVVDVNVKGVLHCIGATLGNMVEKGSGHVINISSILGKKALPHIIQNTPYCGSKFFIQGFTSGMRQELAPKGIKVCTVCPAGVATDLWYKISDPDVKAITDKFVGTDPTKAIQDEVMLTSDDIADTVLYILKQPSRVAINDVVVEPRAVALV